MAHGVIYGYWVRKIILLSNFILEYKNNYRQVKIHKMKNKPGYSEFQVIAVQDNLQNKRSTLSMLNSKLNLISEELSGSDLNFHRQTRYNV
jgi:hypothetical protein